VGSWGEIIEIDVEQIKDNIFHKTNAVTFQFQANFLECYKQEKTEVAMKIPFTLKESF
jgi:hypothetical protein